MPSVDHDGGWPLADEAAEAAWGDERGATLALVALSLVWIVGMAAIVVDIGDGWLSRQTLIAASDAAALAAAQDLVAEPLDEVGACATARSYVSENAPEATQVGCVVAPIGTEGGQVSVTISEDFESRFIELDGDDPVVGSTSTVAWGPPDTITGLRPFALCYDGAADLQTLIDNPPPGPTEVEVPFTRDDPADCGGELGVGNFVTVDFEGGASITAIRTWMLRGYSGQVGFDPLTTIGCASPAVCFERPYASNVIRYEIQLLRARGTAFLFPVFDYADVDEVHLVGIVRARLVGYQLDGEPETWSIDIEVEPGLVAGTCCGPPDRRAGTKVIAICGVDPGVYGNCEETAG